MRLLYEVTTGLFLICCSLWVTRVRVNRFGDFINLLALIPPLTLERPTGLIGPLQWNFCLYFKKLVKLLHWNFMTFISVLHLWVSYINYWKYFITFSFFGVTSNFTKRAYEARAWCKRCGEPLGILISCNLIQCVT